MPDPHDSVFERAALAAAKPRFVHRLEVRFQDVDAAGIVFYARFFDYFHDAYVAFLAKGGFPLPEVLRTKAWAAPLVHAAADYMSPARFGDPLEVGLVRARWDRGRLTLGHRVARAGSGEMVAVGRTVHVWVEPERFQRIEPPPALRSWFEQLEG
jgi:1,4-dihydroxy-2-naphthoyl-CoA hydrolase